MARREVQRLDIQTAQVTLRSPPNWTAVLFFAALSGLHLFIATTAFLDERWEAFMSLIFGVAFASLAIACRLVHTELSLMNNRKVVRIRTGTRRFFIERLVPYSAVHSVRLTLLEPQSPQSASIELVCEHDVIDCPPTDIPRQEALCLAVMLNVRLIKVYGEAFGASAERLDQLHV